MKKLEGFGRVLFAAGLIGLGGTHFLFQRFAAGRAPAWPASLPGELVWVYASGAFLMVMGTAILTRRRARSAALLAAGLVAIWALLRHIPVVAASPVLSGAWTDAGKSLRVIGGALAVAATVPGEGWANPRVSRFVNRTSEFVVAARILVGATLIVNGIQHFLFTEFVASLIPAWFPGDAVSWTYFAGVALIAGGSGLVVPSTSRLAALLSGSMVFSWFWIVHIPIATRTVSSGIAVFEVLVTSGSLFAIAGFLYAARVDGDRGEPQLAARTDGAGERPPPKPSRGAATS